MGWFTRFQESFCCALRWRHQQTLLRVLLLLFSARFVIITRLNPSVCCFTFSFFTRGSRNYKKLPRVGACLPQRVASEGAEDEEMVSKKSFTTYRLGLAVGAPFLDVFSEANDCLPCIKTRHFACVVMARRALSANACMCTGW